LTLYEGLWATLATPLIRRMDAQTVHHQVIEALRVADTLPLMPTGAGWLQQALIPDLPTPVGGVMLPHPLILAAGFVKGDGFADEGEALAAVATGRNIIPGWRVMPALVGAVEFGSFTRHPRLGNSGRVLWRDDATASTQNRIGLRNPGARAAAAFLAAWRDQLPAVWGINIAVSPGVSNPEQEAAEMLEAVGFFTALGIQPSWFTLNLSCPNTEDDPGAHQTAAKARHLGAALVGAVSVPVWIKVSPGIALEQVRALAEAFADIGVRAVVATNTLGQPTPEGSAIAGVGGGRLRGAALATARLFKDVAPALDVIACGGILTGGHLRESLAAGAAAAMIYSALVFRGPLAAGVILGERGGG